MSSSTASHNKQFTLYTTKGANPWKVSIVLLELGLSYHSIFVDMKTNAHKEPEYTKLNPNGRIPTLIDHNNNDFTIWESGAIILYLVGKYDTDYKISFADFDTTAIANQYLMFQMSGQGPYMGQLGWFRMYHAEKIPSAIDRYMNETKRILGVLDKILEGKKFLVNDKLSYADISFVPWNWFLDRIPQFEGWRTEFPRVGAWDDELNARSSIVKAKEEKAALFEAQIPIGGV